MRHSVTRVTTRRSACYVRVREDELYVEAGERDRRAAVPLRLNDLHRDTRHQPVDDRARGEQFEGAVDGDGHPSGVSHPAARRRQRRARSDALVVAT